MKPVTLRQSHVSAFRLTRHHFRDRHPAGLTNVCGAVCGIQAQVMSSAEMQLWARMHHLKRAEIQSALLESRALVKTSLMRQTLHLIPAADFLVFVTALKKSRVDALRRIMSKYGGIDQAETAALNDLIVDALGARPLTQPELMEGLLPRVSKQMKKYIELVWSIQIFRPALVEGLICYGPERGKKPTFIRVDQWLPPQKKIAEQEAEQILLRRYLRAYGPATPQDFSRWSGMQMTAVKPLWESIVDELVEVVIDEKKAFILREDMEHLTHAQLDEGILRLLPAFDPYMQAHADKSHLVDAADYKKVYRNQGWLSPVVLLNGRVIGIWSYRRSGKKCTMEVEPFESLTKIMQKRIAEEADSLGKFLDVSLDVQIKKPSRKAAETQKKSQKSNPL